MALGLNKILIAGTYENTPGAYFQAAANLSSSRHNQCGHSDCYELQHHLKCGYMVKCVSNQFRRYDYF